MPIKRTKLLDRTVNVRDARLYVVATEGEKTEAQYLEMFRNPRVRVVTLPTDEAGLSAPRHVLNRLDAFQDSYDLGADDELWLMIDVDHHRADKLSDICQEATQKGIYLAISNPCFEYWLALHFADTAEIVLAQAKCKAVEDHLRERLGSYNKSRLDTERFRSHIPKAIERAKSLDLDATVRWPGFPGTHVYKLVERLIAP